MVSCSSCWRDCWKGVSSFMSSALSYQDQHTQAVAQNTLKEFQEILSERTNANPDFIAKKMEDARSLLAQGQLVNEVVSLIFGEFVTGLTNRSEIDGLFETHASASRSIILFEGQSPVTIIA